MNELFPRRVALAARHARGTRSHLPLRSIGRSRGAATSSISSISSSSPNEPLVDDASAAARFSRPSGSSFRRRSARASARAISIRSKRGRNRPRRRCLRERTARSHLRKYLALRPLFFRRGNLNAHHRALRLPSKRREIETLVASFERGEAAARKFRLARARARALAAPGSLFHAGRKQAEAFFSIFSATSGQRRDPLLSSLLRAITA